ncbi:MAG: RNHCP domain-containing protein [Alphaproteobacteria bacterium]|nr:RNHCP domain-containing protein [Alphaproteobacteria bacterium]
MPKLFTKKTEDFICEVCGTTVHGDGYTNHCPVCLTSKHVDNQPGDRLATCHGMMHATTLEVKGDSYILTHVCEKCNHTRKNKSAPKDSFKALLALSEGKLTEHIKILKKKF